MLYFYFTFRRFGNIRKSVQMRLSSYLAGLLAPSMDEGKSTIAQCTRRISFGDERSAQRSHLYGHSDGYADPDRPTITGRHELSRERPKYGPQFEQNICDLYFTLLHILLCNIMILTIKSLLLLYFIINKERVYFLLLL